MGWQDNILFILFSVLTELNLTCGTWASLVIQGQPLVPSGSGPHFALAQKGLGYRMGRTTSLGLTRGSVARFSNPISKKIILFIFDFLMFLKFLRENSRKKNKEKYDGK